jgi:hypothetical protein
MMPTTYNFNITHEEAVLLMIALKGLPLNATETLIIKLNQQFGQQQAASAATAPVYAPEATQAAVTHGPANDVTEVKVKKNRKTTTRL